MLGAVPHAINSGAKYMIFRPFTLFQIRDAEKDEQEQLLPIDKGYYYKFNC